MAFASLLYLAAQVCFWRLPLRRLKKSVFGQRAAEKCKAFRDCHTASVHTAKEPDINPAGNGIKKADAAESGLYTKINKKAYSI